MKKVTVGIVFFFVSFGVYCQDFYSEPWQSYTLLTSRRLAKFSQYSNLANDFKKISRSTADSATILYKKVIQELELEATIKPKYDTSFANYYRKSTDFDWFFNCDLPSDINELEASIQTNQNKQTYTPIDTLLVLTMFDFCRFNSLRFDYYSSQIYAFTCLEVFAKMYGKTSKLYIEALMLYGVAGQLAGRHRGLFFMPFVQKAKHKAKELFSDSSALYLKTLFAELEIDAKKDCFALMDNCSVEMRESLDNISNKKSIHADYFSKIGHLYLLTNNILSARMSFKEALEIRKQMAKSEEVKSVYDFASLWIAEKKYKDAKELLEEVLSKESKNKNRYTPFLFILLSQIAYESKDMDNLKKTITKAEILFKLLDNYPAEYYWLKAELYKSQGDLYQADEFYRKAFSICYYENSIPKLDKIGKLNLWYQLQRNKPEICDVVMEELINRKTESLDFFEKLLSDNEKEILKEPIRNDFTFFLNVLYRSPKSKNLTILFDYYNTAHNSIQRNSLIISKIKPISKLDSTKLESFKKINAEISKLLYSDSTQKLDTLMYIKSFIEIDLARKYGMMMNEDSEGGYELKEKLSNNDAFIQLYPFYLLDNNLQKTDSLVYVAFCVTKTDSIIRFTFFKNGSQLENHFFTNYQNGLGNSDNEVFKRFWQPISQLFKEKKHLFICLGGVYHKLNIGAIMQPNGRLLMEDYDIRIVTSARELIEQKEKKNYENTAVLVGNPAFNLAAPKQAALAANYTRSYTETPLFAWPTLTRGSIAPLPNTKAEVENIGKILQAKGFKTQTLLGEQALEEAVKSVKSPRILHIATHGFFEADVTKKDSLQADDFMGIQRARAAENPLLRSGLLLAGAENYLKTKKLSNDHENGILTAYEAMNLDLENTELVVLSACETGLGEIKNGEGVYGLQRALRIAGAQSVLMSLAKVPDAPTKILMEAFYENWLTKGMNKHEALKQAQLTVRKMPQYAAPVNWAAFVLVE